MQPDPTEASSPPSPRTPRSAAAGDRVGPPVDPTAWLRDHGDALFAYAIGRVRDRAVAEDLVQDTLLTALVGRDAFRGDSSERTWLVGILRHKLLRHWRDRGRGPIAIDELVDPAIVERSFAALGKWDRRARPVGWPPGAGVEEVRAALEQCIEGLSPVAAEAFMLGESRAVDPEVICKILGISRTNYYVLRHRARLALRACVERRLHGESDDPG